MECETSEVREGMGYEKDSRPSPTGSHIITHSSTTCQREREVMHLESRARDLAEAAWARGPPCGLSLGFYRKANGWGAEQGVHGSVDDRSGLDSSARVGKWARFSLFSNEMRARGTKQRDVRILWFLILVYLYLGTITRQDTPIRNTVGYMHALYPLALWG